MLTNCHQLCTNLLISNNVLKPQEDTSLLENLMNCADASFSRQFHESVIFSSRASLTYSPDFFIEDSTHVFSHVKIGNITGVKS